jgi:hypothetical protein
MEALLVTLGNVLNLLLLKDMLELLTASLRKRLPQPV